ncbi:MAG: hypothetical protein CVU47_06345 [Chloroflexi bacterium HGW-Chloroflexi-9]|nr:MAG: hypothetical protein CVU47_06345 [Chloroflexi bacterium HGW-Chloroflexi-9]
MGTAIQPLNKVQIGREANGSKGTLVAATRLLHGTGTLREEQDFYRSPYPAGVRANVGGAGSITRKGFGLAWETELTAEEVLWSLLTGVRGQVTPTQATVTGTADAAVTTSSTTLADSRATLVVNGWVGATITCDSKTAVVVSNTATEFTVASWTGGTPTTGSAWSVAGLGYTWVFTPELTTGIPTIDTATLEAIRSDGSTNHYYAEAGYGMTSGFDFEWAGNDAAKFKFDMFARARQTDTPTSSLVVYPSREVLVTPLLSVYLDTTWAGLGGTQLTGIVRSIKASHLTGFAPNYNLEGRSDLDFAKHKVGALTSKLSMVLELDAVGAARWTAYRANSLQYVRLKSVGSTIAGSGGLAKTVQVDGAYRFTAPPAEQVDGEQMLIACELESVYDDTGTKTLEFTTINAVAAASL